MKYLAGRRGRHLGPLKLYLNFSALCRKFAATRRNESRGIP